MAVALLPNELTGALLAVEAAWGADLTAADTTWTWTDITADVRLAPGIDISLGRSDEASTTQPASCTLTLDNAAGKYSLGPQSPNYPTVRRGTPVRVRVRPSTAGVYTTVFQGGSVSWQPDWTTRGNVSTVALTAAGALRRLGQGAPPVTSPIRRFLTSASAVVAYWPCEDGIRATQFAPARPSGLPMSWSGGTPKLASNTDFLGSQPLPVLRTSSWLGTVPAYTPAADYSTSVRFLASFPTTGPTNGFAQLAKIFFDGGSAGSLVCYYSTGGALGLKAFTRDGTLLYDTGAVAFLVDGKQRFISVEMYQSGGNVYLGLSTMQQGETFYVQIGVTTAYAGTLGLVRAVQINPYADLPDVAAGHVAVLNVRSATDPLTDANAQLNAYTGEGTTDRAIRLCTENSVPLTVQGATADGSSQITSTMGPQAVDRLLPLLRTCEAAARGLLYDGTGSGLSYRSRAGTENRLPDLTITATAAQLDPGFGPVDDDQRLLNKATISRPGGSAFTVEDVTGPLGTAVVGTYETSGEVNVTTDEAAAIHAAWLVSRGTTVGYRYPLISLNLRATPSLAAAWLAVTPGTRIDVTGLGTVLPGHPAGTLSLLVEGVTHRFAAAEWTGTAKCSLYDVWAIGTVGAATSAGDDVWVLRADTDALTTTAIAAASTTVTVAGSPPWITTAGWPGEFPFDAEIGGRQVTVTAITGTASPQTFTITPTGVAIASGSTVRLWNPRRIGL